MSWSSEDEVTKQQDLETLEILIDPEQEYEMKVIIALSRRF